MRDVGVQGRWFIFVLLMSQIIVNGCRRESTEQSYRLLLTNPPLTYVVDGGKPIPDSLSGRRETFSQVSFNTSAVQPSSFSRDGVRLLNNLSGLIWKPFQSKDSVLQLDRMLRSGDNQIAYIAERVEMPCDTSLYLSLGSDDGFILWVNGDSIASHSIGRSVHPDDELIPVRLHQGANVLLYKVTQRDGSWGLYRAFRTKKQAMVILQTKIPVMFGDLPQSCILEDSESWLHLNSDTRRRIDSLHYIFWCWRDWNGTVLDSIVSIPVYALSDSISLPPISDKFLLWDVSVTGQDKTILFREQIPIAFKDEVVRRVRQINRDSLSFYNNGADAQARFKAIQSVFARIISHDTTAVVYATRDQMQVLFGAWSILHKNPESYVETGVQLYGIGNPPKQEVTAWRMFSPTVTHEDHKQVTIPTVLALHVDFDNTDDYWQTYQAQSHTLSWRWTAFSDFYRMHIISPYFSGSVKGFSGSSERLHHLLQQASFIDSGRKMAPITALAWSKGAITLLELLKKPWFRVNNVALISPFLPENSNEVLHEIIAIKQVHPDIHWLIWHGLDDTDVPVFINRQFVKLLKEQRFTVSYTEVPYSTYWNYFTDPEQELYQAISKERSIRRDQKDSMAKVNS